jgi:hypothetical protein
MEAPKSHNFRLASYFIYEREREGEGKNMRKDFNETKNFMAASEF